MSDNFQSHFINRKNTKRSFIINNKMTELLIPGYPKGSDLTIIDISYIGAYYNKELEQYEKDYISIIFRDNTSGRKKSYVIYEPQYTFFRIKDKYCKNYNQFFLDTDKTIPCTCRYRFILQAIAEVTDRIDEYKEYDKRGEYAELRKFHADPRIMFSDMGIENYYRFLFGLSYTNNSFKLRKGYMDIETDIMYSDLQFPEPGQVPINAYAYCDEANNTVYQFLLNDKNNPLVEKYKQSFYKENIIKQLKEFIINAVGGIKKAKKFGVDKLNYKIVFFDDELELITKMFELVHTTSPDFIEFWNMSFDLNYIIERINKLGGDSLNIICDNRIEQQYLKYYIDTRNINNYEERGDFVSCSSYTVYIDQMIEFASRRKGRGAYQSFRLDAIGEVIAGVHKLDYSHITSNLGNLPYIDFKTFSFYNVMDVIVQKCIETITSDLEYVFTKCIINNTTYAKCHRQSIYLTNRFSKEFYQYGYIIGNNKNKWNEKPSTKFPGAMVGDPLHNSPKVMIHVNGRPTLLTENMVDFDYSSLYPSIILENNIAPNTQIGRIVIGNNDTSLKYSLEEHHDMYASDDNTAKYSRGGEFLENLMCNNPLEFGRRWMGLGTVYDVIDDIIEFGKFNGYYGRPITTTNKDAVYFTNRDGNKMIEAISFDEFYMSRPCVYIDDELTQDKKQNLIEYVKENAIL